MVAMVEADLLRAINQTQPTAAMLVKAETAEAEGTRRQVPAETAAMQVVLALPEMPDLQPVAATEPTAAMAQQVVTVVREVRAGLAELTETAETAERQATAHQVVTLVLL